MERTNINIYLVKALAAYPYDLEEAIESLNYALSYDTENAQALYLMGKVYAEQFNDYEGAKEYFAEAMAHNMEIPSLYTDYILTMFLNEDYEEAEKLIDFAKKVKSSDKAILYILEGRLQEAFGKYKKAISALEESKKYCYNNNYMEFAENEIGRVKKKLPKKNKKKSNNKRKEK